jgi:hypothetical protein
MLFSEVLLIGKKNNRNRIVYENIVLSKKRIHPYFKRVYFTF